MKNNRIMFIFVNLAEKVGGRVEEARPGMCHERLPIPTHGNSPICISHTMFSCSRIIVYLKVIIYTFANLMHLSRLLRLFTILFKYPLWIVASFALGKRPVEVAIASYWSAVKFVRNYSRVGLCHIEIYLV